MTSSNASPFGDTTLTKVFVGGLAWETPKEALKEHFEKYGEILEAVIIADKLTGRSKGYGFVTFKDAEATKKACEDPAPIINGRRANCNLASLGARRANRAPTPPPLPPPPPRQGSNPSPPPPPAMPAHSVQWYYPTGTPASPFHHHYHHNHVVPFYGYSPTYTSTDLRYNQKLGYTGGSYMNGHFSQMYPAQPIMGPNTLMPMYPFYQYPQTQTLGLPVHVFPTAAASPVATVPAFISKPVSMAPNPGTVGGGGNFKEVV